MPPLRLEPQTAVQTTAQLRGTAQLRVTAQPRFQTAAQGKTQIPTRTFSSDGTGTLSKHAVTWWEAPKGSKKGCRRVGTTGSRIAAFEGPPFVLGQSTPDSSVLAGLDSPFQTRLNHLASTAYGLCFRYLEKRRASVPNREEQLRVLGQAGSVAPPCHQDRTPCIEV